MRKGDLTRLQAIEKIGIDAVEAVDRENCDFTGRVQTDGDEGIEFSSSIEVDGDILIAYFYQTQDDLDAAGDDLSNCNWEIAGYEIV